jgi:hypothetical protein
MFYAWDITIPAGTSDSNPETQKLDLTVGTIKNITVKFPAGCHGTVKVRLLRPEFQLVPLSKDEWITGDDEAIPTETRYEIIGTPTYIKFVGCSPDASYDHTISIRIELEPTLTDAEKQIISKLTNIEGAVKIE